jgi:hypothetical protein
MPDPTNPQQPAAAHAREEALSWLAGQFRWESLLADLHDLATRQAAPVVELERRSGDHEDAESAA